MHVDYVDTDQQWLAAAEKFGVMSHDRVKLGKSWDRHPATLYIAADFATLRATWRTASVLIAGSTTNPC
ncbi:hypothetical protein DIJ64_06825 [Mycobacterium leprae]|uniref:Uncharacterized protein n=1 Tax=Mycobacterium leprae TaxID=1769 RepID=A0AAD0KR13_MYCLR|nr:hypothetical protein [Mycobacterium leprae]AWV47884.1 hypothetical protein DIJ64_06825 [Mycobacterium leprae]OAR20752.1 hypothetical protein A8144_09420 [Mycobacterium leprae 3125609]OAX70906.1 hypothetical protein A3216_08995 [Mycobacterium leprae 7935681]